MKLVKINFVDFWPGFEKTNNYFYNLLVQKYQLSISDDPEIIFYSYFGAEYLNFKCIRIYFTGENIRPDFTGCDYALSFDYICNTNHYRLPLYKLWINTPYNDEVNRKSIKELTFKPNIEDLKIEWNKKTKFCCIVVSNPTSQKRMDFFRKLSKYKHVDSGGRTMNNIGGPVEDKIEFIKDYRFVISFENAIYPGYTTEKILEPMFTNSIPIYWGNPLVGQDFNKKRFLDYSDFESEEDLIKKILEIENNPELAIAMLSEPVFPDNKIPECIKDENIFKFLGEIIATSGLKTPVAQTYKRYLHPYHRLLLRISRSVKPIKHRIKSGLKI